jgi:ABC-type branched-subunit amino acid transport system substrate-binding protein
MAVPDTAFRLCPTDLGQVDPILHMLDDFEVNNVIIIQRGDAWADGIVAEFESKYGGQIIEKTRYSGEATDFSRNLEEAETAIIQFNESEKPCIFLVSFTEASSLLAQATDYPSLLNTTWFGTDGTADDRLILEESEGIASKVKLIGPQIAVNPEYSGFEEVNRLYGEEFGRGMDFFQANIYDCCWLMAYCVIDTNSTEGLTLQSNILEVASNHRGITGELSLNENGDRDCASYVFYGYFEVEGVYFSEKCGFYNSDLDMILWDDKYVKLN